MTEPDALPADVGGQPPGLAAEAPAGVNEADPASAETDPGWSQTLSGRADSVAERFGKSDWIELAAAFLLAFATIASAWSAYQATRWSGVQANAFSAASAARTESVRASTTASTVRQIDVAVFVAWLQAYANDQTGLTAFYEARFRAEFKPAFDAWLASVPAGSVPDGSPFSRPEYVLAAQTQADELLAEAESQSATARSANQTGDNFILVVVLMASVLFFAGVGTKFKGQRIRRAMIAIAGIVFLAGLGAIISLPPNVGI
jgi:hypothetical protein